jgi:predicted ATP-grasp superfamily ATP-dependent carboligase
MSACRPNSAHILAAGVSTRAVAESAARAGYEVTTLDAFADLDQPPRVRALSLPRDFGVRFSAAAAARAARNIDCDAVVYGSGFENHPRAVATLGTNRVLWGNPPDVLRRVRDPWLLADALRRRGLAAPVARAEGATSMEEGARWLVKPVRSGGGSRVREWRAGRALPRGCYLQERIEGTCGSAVFVAAKGRAVVLGVSRQLVGDAAFGASGYQYCGSILMAVGNRDDTLEPATASALVSAIAEEFGLVGVNGVDFVVDRRVPYTIEVNPRWSASMELVERAHGLSVFGVHAASCGEGALPAFDQVLAARAAAAGKAVVFARHDVLIGETGGWLEDNDVRDVPRPGERILAGRPVCTVFATGLDAEDCRARLVERADRVFEQLARWNRRAI